MEIPKTEMKWPYLLEQKKKYAEAYNTSAQQIYFQKIELVQKIELQRLEHRLSNGYLMFWFYIGSNQCKDMFHRTVPSIDEALEKVASEDLKKAILIEFGV